MEVTKLTESMVLHVTKKSSLDEVTTVNIWGMQISDVSLVARLPNLEVLSMSLNRINTLRHFSKCRMLKELYVRKNCIASLEEIVYLKDLPRLRILWLAENDCHLKNSCYRKFVLRYLPHLTKLDNEDVTEDEVKEAMNDEPNAEMRRLIALANELERFQKAEEENKRLEEMVQKSLSSNLKYSPEAKGVGSQSKAQAGALVVKSAAMGIQSNPRPRSAGPGRPRSTTAQSAANFSEVKSNARSNILSAVLALLNELDDDGLGIVQLRCQQLSTKR